jgi:hypothetical protein
MSSAGDAGAVDENVVSGSLVQTLRERAAVADVERETVDRCAVRRKRVARRVELVFGPRKQCYMRAALCKSGGGSEPNAAASPGDERAAPVKSESRRPGKGQIATPP